MRLGLTSSGAGSGPEGFDLNLNPKTLNPKALNRAFGMYLFRVLPFLGEIYGGARVMRIGFSGMLYRCSRRKP